MPRPIITWLRTQIRIQVYQRTCLLKASLVYVLRLELITILRGWKDSSPRPGQSAAQHWIGLFGLDPNRLISLCDRTQNFGSSKQNGKISSKVFKNRVRSCLWDLLGLKIKITCGYHSNIFDSGLFQKPVKAWKFPRSKHCILQCSKLWSRRFLIFDNSKSSYY